MKIIGKIILTWLILLSVDAGLHKSALRIVIEKAQKDIREMESFADVFEENLPVASQISMSSIREIFEWGHSAEEQFREAAQLFIGAPSSPILLFANEYENGERVYRSYLVKACGQAICPFDPNQIQNASEEGYKQAGRRPVYSPFIPKASFDIALYPAPDLTKIQRIDEVSRSVSWGFFYGFELVYEADYNGMDELISANAGVVDYPRNFFSRTLRQLGSGVYPYGKTNEIYYENFVLGSSAFFE